MNEDQPRREGDRPDGDQGADLTRPFAPLNPPTRPQQRAPQQQPPHQQPPHQQPPQQQGQQAPWTQQREHRGATPMGRDGQWPQPAPHPQAAYPQSPGRSGAGGAFVAALISTLVVIGVSVGASYAATHASWASSDARAHLYNAGLAIWPSSLRLTDNSYAARAVLKFDTTSYLAAFVVAGVVLLLLLWAAVASVPGGRGSFGVFLAGWGATVVAGVVAVTVEFLIASSDLPVSRLINAAFEGGGLWAVHVGWIVGLVAAVGQSLRRRG